MEAATFSETTRFVGVGAIATAGIFGIVKSLRVVASSIGAAAFQGRRGASSSARTGISIMAILLGVIVSTIAVAIQLGSLHSSIAVAAIGVVLVLFFSFFFTSVAALCIATTARNPVSGMTMLTIIVSSIVLLNFGILGTTGMFFVMMIPGMVCWRSRCQARQSPTEDRLLAARHRGGRGR
jgi:uncharacterized oligopeptide transporter (OPT) family protein